MYFNGSGGFRNWSNGEWVPYVAPDKFYCDECAETQIPLPTKEAFLAQYPGRSPGGRHQDTGFKWAPYFGGDTCCSCCGKKV